MTLEKIVNQYQKLFNKTDDAFTYMGAQKLSNGLYAFSVYAPEASKVFLFGDFNEWREDDICLTKHSSGVWYCAVQANELDQYKFIIYTKQGKKTFKADPFAFYSQTSGKTNSIIFQRKYEFCDEQFIFNRQSNYDKAVNIYEINLGSWQKEQLDKTNPKTKRDLPLYRKIAKPLANYLKQHSFTHVEFLPLTEYPLLDSWGYQVTGYFSPTSRYGTPDDLRYLVDTLHKHGISVILDWVPAHFCKDEFGLIEFDGSYLFESADNLRREREQWGTRVFDLEKPFVVTFLLSSARYFAQEFHFDGFRVDAVASMLYLDYAREGMEWRPNIYGENINLESINFFRDLSKSVFAYNPGAMLIAEESTAFYGVTKPADAGGLGFNYKWNMGWMNDILSYFQTDFPYRKEKHNKLTFPMMYAYSENFILPFSHDEVVHGKGSLINKMPGTYQQKFDGIRLLFALLYTYSGKKLNFMGNEFGQFAEWNFTKELDWSLHDFEKHRELNEYFKALSKLYVTHPALFEQDYTYYGFDFIQCDDPSGILAYFRTSKSDERIFCLFNLSNTDRQDYKLTLPKGRYKCIFSHNVRQEDFTINNNQVKSFEINALSVCFYLHKQPISRAKK